jgi:hypothetical protein
MKPLRVFLLAALAMAAANLAAQQTPQARQATVSEPNKLFSDDLNTELPRWLRFGAEYRARVEGFTGGGFKPDKEDAYLLSRGRINMFLLPTKWLKFGFQGQDAHVFWRNQNPASPPYQDAMDLRLAYVEIGDTEKKTIGFRAGRQELAFGDERLIGNANWLNTARSFDALRGTYRRHGYRLDLFAARVVKAQDGEFDWSTPGNNFYFGTVGLRWVGNSREFRLWDRNRQAERVSWDRLNQRVGRALGIGTNICKPALQAAILGGVQLRLR